MVEQMSPSDSRSVPGDDSLRPTVTAVVSLVGSLASVVVSALAYGPLPARIRIHWSFGGPYIGPEFAPAWLVLTVFPILVATVALGLYWVGIRLRSHEAYSTVRPYYGLLMLGIVGMLVVVQVGIIVVNLLT